MCTSASSGRRSRQKLVDAAIGESIRAFVSGVSGVPFDPNPFDFMRRTERVELLPEIGVFNGLFVRCFPAVALPVVDPLADSFLHVLRIGVHAKARRLREGFERGNDRREFHPVIRRISFATPQLLFVRTDEQERAPAARPRIAPAAAVGVDVN